MTSPKVTRVTLSNAFISARSNIGFQGLYVHLRTLSSPYKPLMSRSLWSGWWADSGIITCAMRYQTSYLDRQPDHAFHGQLFIVTWIATCPEVTILHKTFLRPETTSQHHCNHLTALWRTSALNHPQRGTLQTIKSPTFQPHSTKTTHIYVSAQNASRRSRNKLCRWQPDRYLDAKARRQEDHRKWFN